MLEEGALSAPGGEVHDGLNHVHPLAGVAELVPPPEVVAGRFTGPLESWRGLGGRLYVLVKLRMKTFVKSSQLLML